jgi:signal transduction histidine kinase
LLAVAIVGMPVAAGIAILKYRLYEIDVVISKTLLVGLLAAFATVVYVVVVVVVGALIGSRGPQPSVLLAVVATAIVALAFQPVRARAQRLADRLVYGERATPYDVLSDLSERLSGAFSADDLIPRMARTLAEGTGAARADVWLRQEDRLVTAGSWPLEAPRLAPVAIDGDHVALELDGADLTAPVRHQGELLGAVTISKRPGEQATPLEERLVRDLAAQAGLVLSNVHLIQELRASRQRLVAAQDEERRKIERNLHDGAQQQLVALAVKQRLAEGLIERDPIRARGLMEELLTETTEALETLRDLAHGIYPPLLADKGLAAALAAQARRASVPVEVQVDDLPRYTTELEAAVYFCCLEALQNVVKYARASRATVTLSADEHALTFVVEDDGVGFETNGTPLGTGLRGMRDRLEALGGSFDVTSRPGSGTTVMGRLPTGAAP